MKLFRPVDDFLNGITMYRLVVYVLGLLLAVSAVFMITGVLSYSFSGFIATSGVLLAACFAANMLLSRLRRVVPNHESGLVTALILACILPQTHTLERAMIVALTGVIAIAVKYLLVWRGSHFLNPAATAAVVVSLTGLLPVTWWIANPSLFIPMALLGVLVLRKTRRFILFGWFALAAVMVTLLVAMVGGWELGSVLQTLVLSYPLLFLGCIMLTEPTTLPAGRLPIALYGGLVGVLFASQLDLGFVSMSPHLALVIGNVFSMVVTPKRGLRLRLEACNEIAPRIYDAVFTQPAGGRLPYAPGQYMEWTIPGVPFDNRGNRRTFTIASSPTEDRLRIGIKTYQSSSAFKRRLLELKPGALVMAGHVGGSFTLPPRSSGKLLFVAGGIGVTPFRSMVKYLMDTHESRDIILIYAAHKGEFVYRKIFGMAEKYGVKTFYFTEQLTDVAIREMAPDFTERIPYVSGPQPLVRGVSDALVRMGVSRSRIRTDLFTGY